MVLVYGQLGERDPALTGLAQLLLRNPEFAAAPWQELQKTWDPELVEHLLDGLRKAGLEGAGDEPWHKRSPHPPSLVRPFDHREILCRIFISYPVQKPTAH